MVDKTEILRAIDDLSPSGLAKLSDYIDFLNFQEHKKDPDWFGKLRDTFAPVREEIEASGMTDDEVNAILDEALEEVRREQKA